MYKLENISLEAISIISSKKAFENSIIPINIENGSLLIGVPNQNDQKLIHELSFLTGLKIKTVEIPPDVILNRLKEIYATEKPQFSNGTHVEKSTMEHSNVEFVNEIISGAIKNNASDIHLEAYEKVFRIRYRIDGHLREIMSLSHNKSLAITSRLKIMANLDISEKRRPQDGKIRFLYNNKHIDIRVSTLPTSFGEKIVLRILDKSSLELDPKRLGLSEGQYEIFYQHLHLPYGMILVTGPTGSGKTTTLYAALNEIHSIEKNIMTVEDPIEYNLEGINQTNVKPDIGLDFATALRAFLRQDPDIIMVGEIRDKETAEIAIRASLTGHLVFSTLHTNDSISAITRMIDMGVEPFLVASSVKLIIAQRLVRKLCTCKTQASNVDSLFEDKNRGYTKKGCEQCSYTGYSGRIALFEILPITENLAELIIKRSGTSAIKQEAAKNGFISLRDSGNEKIKLGITSYDEVIRETSL